MHSWLTVGCCSSFKRPAFALDSSPAVRAAQPVPKSAVQYVLDMLRTAGQRQVHLPGTGDTPSARGCDAVPERSCSCDNQRVPRSESGYVLLSPKRISDIFGPG